MSSSTMTLIILIVNVFFIGIITAIAARYVHAHYSLKNKSKDIDGEVPRAELPPEIKAKILKEAEGQFQKVLDNSSVYLQQGLVSTATDLNRLVKNLVTQIINSELVKYHQEMDKMRQLAETELGGVKKEMDGHKDELKANLAQEIAVEKRKLIKQIDTRLADAVGSFLVETLGHNVDLGNQNEYLKSLLEEHKAEFAKEVTNEPNVTE